MIKVNDAAILDAANTTKFNLKYRHCMLHSKNTTGRIHTKACMKDGLLTEPWLLGIK